MSNPSLFGIHARALGVWNRRMQVLASNLANTDTPNYQARDIDFKKVLSTEQPPGVALATTEPGHIAGQGGDARLGRLMYRVPMQPSEDGNTVNTQVEQAAFGENAVHYQASLTFISNKIHQLKLAIGDR
jgi:flagellar basal-body rod protein FlgB